VINVRKIEASLLKGKLAVVNLISFAGADRFIVINGAKVWAEELRL